MKRSILFSFLLVLFSSSIFASTNEIDLTKILNPNDPRPLSLTFLPVTATISETTLSVYFDLPVGDATITVYDGSDNVIYQQTVDTDSSLEADISSSSWSSGSYYVTITYDTTKLIGNFEME